MQSSTAVGRLFRKNYRAVSGAIPILPAIPRSWLYDYMYHEQCKQVDRHSLHVSLLTLHLPLLDIL